MNSRRAIKACIAALPLTLAGCGGSSSDTSAGVGPEYPFTPPPLNSTRFYDETVVDNSNNTINLHFAVTVTAVNADGSYAILMTDPSQSTVIVDGTNYSIITETDSLNNSGQLLIQSNFAENARPVTCTFAPHGAGPDFPVRVEESWTLDYSYTCGNGTPVAYAQMGYVADIESITVPAGTYSTIKLQSTITWTDSLGTTRTQTISNWRDVATSILVQEIISIAYSGTTPTGGYPVSRKTVLLSSS
jgi:hypothetical protein